LMNSRHDLGCVSRPVARASRPVGGTPASWEKHRRTGRGRRKTMAESDLAGSGACALCSG
jgi:hypothetical protein